MAFVHYYLNDPAYRITLCRVICNLPNVETQTYVDKDASYRVSMEKVAAYNDCLEQLRERGVSIHKAHVGQLFHFCGMTLEVLFTYDLLSPTLPDAFYTSDIYRYVKEFGVIPNSTGRSDDFSNNLSVVCQSTVTVDADASYKLLWMGDHYCLGAETLNATYGFALKSDFLQIPHHGMPMMFDGKEDEDPIIKYYHKSQYNHFFGAVAEAVNEEFTRERFPAYFDEDGSYGFVRAKYLLLPSSIVQSKFFDDIDNAHPEQDVTACNNSHLAGWKPIFHLQDEARLAGGDCYLARYYLTLFYLGKTVTVEKDFDLTRSGLPIPSVT